MSSLKRFSGVLGFVFLLHFTLAGIALAGHSLVTKDNRVVLDQDGSARVLPLGFRPAAVASADDQRLVYALDSRGRTLRAIDAATGATLRILPLDGKAVALEYDRGQASLLVLQRQPNELRVLDVKSQKWTSVFSLAGSPLSLAVDGARRQAYVGFQDKNVIRMSLVDGREQNRITDLEDAPLAIHFDDVTDRLIFRQARYVSLYSRSGESFVDYLRLEAIPGRMQLDSRQGMLYMLLQDEPDVVAGYDLKSLEVADWKNLKYRTYNGRKPDASTFFVDANGSVRFFDETSGSFVDFEQTTFEGPSAPVAIPPGYTASNDIPINPNEDNGTQQVPNSELDGLGNFIAVWTDDAGNDGSGEGAFVRRFAPMETPLESEFAAPQAKGGDQGSPSVGADADGDFVVLWRDSTEKDGNQFGVFGRVFDGSVFPAVATTGDILINQTTSGRQMMPWVDSKPNGDFIAAWSGKWTGTERQTFTRRFAANGTAQAGEVRANTTVKGNTWAVQVDVNSSGQYVTTWRDDGDNGIRGRAYDASGNPVAGSAFVAGPYSGAGAGKTFAPSVAIKEDGSFIVVWKENPAGGIVGQKFDANQNGIGTFKVTSQQTGSNEAPNIAVAADGRFVVCWRDAGYANEEIAARIFDSAGVALGPDFIVPQNPAGDEFEPHCSMDLFGNVFLIWKDRDRTPNIYGRYLFTATPAPPITVSSITANTGNQGDTNLTLNIQGDGFEDGATVAFEINGVTDPNITVNSVTFNSATSLDVNIDIGALTILGLHDVKVTVNTSSGVGNDLFEVKAAGGIYPVPGVTSLNPSSGEQNSSLTLDITGTNFANAPGLTVDFGADITINGVSFVNSTTISVNITIGGSAATGLRDVTVSNPATAAGTCTDCFDVIFNPTLFADNFNDLDYAGWTPDKGTWSASTGGLVGTSTSGKATIIATGFAGCTVCSMQADIRTGTGETAKVSFMAWYADNNNHVELIMDKTKDKWIMKYRSGGTVVDKAKYNDTVDLGVNIQYPVRIDYDGTTLSLYVRDLPAPVATLAAPGLSGTVGFRVKDTNGTIDNVEVNP